MPEMNGNIFVYYYYLLRLMLGTSYYFKINIDGLIEKEIPLLQCNIFHRENLNTKKNLYFARNITASTFSYIFGRIYTMLYYCTLSTNSILEREYEVQKIRPVFPTEYLENIDPSNIYIFLYDHQYTDEIIIEKNLGIISNPEYTSGLLNINYYELLLAKRYLNREAHIYGLTYKNNRLLGYLIGLMISTVLSILIFSSAIYILNNIKNYNPVYESFKISSKILDPKQIPTEEKYCSICIDTFNEKSNIRELGCSHFFHQECIDKWLLEHSAVCPLCRLEIEIIDIE